MLLTWSPWRWEINILLTFPALTRLFWSWIWDPSPQSNIQDPSSTKKNKSRLNIGHIILLCPWEHVTKYQHIKQKLATSENPNMMPLTTIINDIHTSYNIHMNYFKQMFRKTEIWCLNPTPVLRMAIKNLVEVYFRNNTLWFQLI